jgi:hypothetical protein
MAKGGGASRPRFRLLATVLLTAAILGLPTVVYAWGRSSSSFAISSISVTGTRLVPKKKAQSLLRRDYLHRNLFTVTTKDVRHTLASLCYVAGVAIDRDFPHTLRVTIVEHRPVVYALSEGRWYVIADNGYIVCALRQAGKGTGTARLAPAVKASGTSGVSPSPAASASGAASVESASSATGKPGSAGASTGSTSGAASGVGSGSQATTVPAVLKAGPSRAGLGLPRIAAAGALHVGSVLEDGNVRGALRVVACLPRTLRARLDVVQASSDGQFMLSLRHGPRVTWGDTRRLVAKSLALRAVLAHYAAAGKTCTFVDVSTPDTTLARPVLK